jgi:hypothetical protein
MIDNLIFALGYTSIMVIVAYYYWIEGNKKGVRETLHIIMQHEPEALLRIRPKLQEMLNVTATDAE